MKSKGRYQKESRKIYRKNQKKKKKIRERLQKEKEREEKVTVSIPRDRVEDVNIGEDGYGNEWVFFKRNRRDDDDHRRSRNNNASSSSSYKRRRSPNYWSPEEEENLKIAVWKYSKNGGKSASWVEIMEKEGQYFQGRTAEDLKDKWRNMTKPPVEGKRRTNCI